MTHANRFASSLVRFLQTLGIAIALVLLLSLAPAIAQGPSKASVVLDGRQVFQVSQAKELTAQERADWINSQLRQAVQSDAPARVRVEQRNQLPTLLVNDRYLLTVTERDTLINTTPTEQAQLWSEQLQSALEEAQTERSFRFIRRALVLTAGVLSVAIVLNLLLGSIWRHYLRQGLERLLPSVEPISTSQPKSLDLFLSLTLAIARAGVWVAASLYITNLFPLTRSWSYRIVQSLITTFTAPILTLGQNSYTITDVLILAALLLGLVGLAGAMTNLLRTRVLRVAGISRGLQEVIAIATKYGLIFIGSIVLLQVWGLDISSLAIVASALGVGIGFGLQDLAKDLGGGLVLVFERPIQVGDFVEVGEFVGTVERIGARSTEIRTLDQMSVIVPNSHLLSAEVVNWNHGNPVSRLHLPLQVAYHSDVEQVRALLLDVASDHPDVLLSPQPQVFFLGFGESALRFELLVWIAEPTKHLVIKSDLNFRIATRLHQHQIEIPFPQRDLHLRSGSLTLSPELEAAILQLSAKLSDAPLPKADSHQNGNHG